jgi:hypothetical protein
VTYPFRVWMFFGQFVQVIIRGEGFLNWVIIKEWKLGIGLLGEGGEIVRMVGWEGWNPGISKIVSKSVYELILFKKLSHLILSEFLT